MNNAFSLCSLHMKIQFLSLVTLSIPSYCQINLKDSIRMSSAMPSLINVHYICLEESRMVCQKVVRGLFFFFFNLGIPMVATLRGQRDL